MNQDDSHIVVRGAKIIVEYGVLDDGSMPSRDFWEGLAQEDQAHLLTTFQHVARYGVSAFHDDRRFKQERTFWAAKKDKCKHGRKGRKMARIVGYRKRDELTNRERLILTHGFWKPPKSEWPESEFGRAQQIRDEIYARERRESNKRGKK